MRKIHVITQKELINPQKLENCTAVVIDVLLATSTIAYAFEKDCKYVIPVKDSETALSYVRTCTDPYLLFGENKGQEIQGFSYPDPTTFDDQIKEKVLIFCSTNGTVAINKGKKAK